jgi:hypothetical protein
MVTRISLLSPTDFYTMTFKDCKSFFRCDRPPIVGSLFYYFPTHQLLRTVELLNVH